MKFSAPYGPVRVNKNFKVPVFVHCTIPESQISIRFTCFICRELLMPDSLNLLSGHSEHFAKFPILRFSKLSSSPNFHPISTKLYCKYVGHEGI